MALRPGIKRLVRPMRSADPALPALALPTGPKTAVIDFFRLVTLYYGRPGIGKSTIGAGYPDALILSCERVSAAISCADFNAENGGVTSWEIFLAAVDLLEKEKGRFRTIVVDTIEAAYQMCFRYVCKKRGVDHPPKNDFGDVWKAIKNEFNSALDRIARTGRGVVFIAHAKEVEITSHSGDSYTRIQPAVASQALEYLKAKTDCVFYCEYLRAKTGESTRVMITEGDEVLDAKHPGSLPRFLPMNPQGGAEYIARAFQGKEKGLALADIRTGKETGKAGAALVEGEKIKEAKKRTAGVGVKLAPKK